MFLPWRRYVMFQCCEFQEHRKYGCCCFYDQRSHHAVNMSIFPIVPRTLNKQYFYCHFQEHGEDNVVFFYKINSLTMPPIIEKQREENCCCFIRFMLPPQRRWIWPFYCDRQEHRENSRCCLYDQCSHR